MDLDFGKWLNMCLGCDKCEGLYCNIDFTCIYMEINKRLYVLGYSNTLYPSVLYNTIFTASNNIKRIETKDTLKEILKWAYSYVE